MVFEKVRGGPLLSHIQRKVCFTEQEASQVTKEIATALKYLHDRGIAHRDVSRLSDFRDERTLFFTL